MGEPDPEVVIAEKDDTRAVVGSASYDILLGFSNQNQMVEFKPMIAYFARRKEDNSGLIASPYYAPVYGTISEFSGYEEVIGLRVNCDHY